MPETTTPATPIQLFQSADGKRWRLAGTDNNGGRLFVPAHLDPEKVKRWVWAKEADLAEAVGALTPIGAVPEDVSPQVAKLRGFFAGPSGDIEDPHDSDLHHTYRLSRDLPEVQA